MTTIVERNVASAEAYYRAMSSKDVAGVAQHLHPDVRFVGPLAKLAGKEAVVEAATGLAARIRNLKIRARFGSEDRVMLAYDVDLGEPTGMCRTAVLMTFDNGLITCIELFFDARPFEKSSTKETIFSSR